MLQLKKKKRLVFHDDGPIGNWKITPHKIPDDCEADIARQYKTLKPRFFFFFFFNFNFFLLK